ncbi:unnamed protein product [Bursaphelenchus xylophilus]|uniref:(pine wood nematode) hypothetical protein n=1 Tax=Bursaphelenchus xylophilus TaxID=6326 RepID=A0A1I7RIX2_BURXY|nr:unnamed protein product [Bursaphelenchus xylophilus]CAG9119152.1 unnamed protein product [Bursaphelenchus xylophilus]
MLLNCASSWRQLHNVQRQLVVLIVAVAVNAVVVYNAGRKSTCSKPFTECEMDETCRWHMSELQMKCRLELEHCRRDQCAAAMRRFSRYVTKEILEGMMFCQCAFSDVQCKHQQQWMYPRCLYESYRVKPKKSCTQTVKYCQHDSYCHRTLLAFNRSCPIGAGAAGECKAKDLHRCRIALIGIRGTDLESPCYCNQDDDTCLENQNMVLPNNPCVEQAMAQFSGETDGSLSVETEELVPSEHTPKNEQRRRGKSRKTTTTTTTTTTDKPSESSKEEEEIEEQEERPTSEDEQTEPTEAEELAVKEEKIPEETTNSTDSTATQSVTVPMAIKQTTVPSKGIKVVVKTNTSTTPKVINDDKLVTQTPPPEGGCKARNIEGDWISHYKNTLFRQYNDLSGRCSSWCQCFENETFSCEPLSCLAEGSCITPQTTVAFGERLYIESRGACLCQSGKFICDTSEKLVELEPGLYISLGFSRAELDEIKKKVPKPLLEKCGLVSPSRSVAKDIASRLQYALERVLPKDTLCRVAMIEEHSYDSVILLQIQWYGVDPFVNTTEPHWHIGKLEKICSPYVRQLEYNFMMERSDRYQLVLSTVKQLRVYDLLDGLPKSAAKLPNFQCLEKFLILVLCVFHFVWRI